MTKFIFHLNPTVMLPIHHDFFMLRRPLFSKELYYNFEAVISKDPAQFEAELIRIFSDPLAQQALYLASPDLYSLVLSLQKHEAIIGKEKVLNSLYKYFLRSTMRCTPFGLFAGYTPGKIDTNSRIRFQKHEPFRCFMRPHMQVAFSLAKKIMDQDPEFSAHILYYPNSSLYKVADQYRYLERILSGDSAEFVLSEIQSGSTLEKVLQKARKGITKDEMTALATEDGIYQAKAAEFIRELIEAQILLSELEVNLTGENYFKRIAQKISAHTDPVFKSLFERFESMMTAPFISTEDLQQLTADVRKTFPEPDLKHLVRTDLRFNASCCTLSQNVTGTLLQELEALQPLFEKPASADLESFARDLHVRYAAKKVPLLRALDYQYGIGYGKLKTLSKGDFPLLEGLDENEQNFSDSVSVSTLAMSLYQQALKKGSRHIELTGEMLESVQKKGTAGFSAPFYLFGALLSESEEKMDQGDFFFELKAMGGPSALNLITRFAMQDAELQENIRQALASETPPQGAIHAEICHFPGFQEAGILTRPSMSTYEIPYLAKSLKEPPFRIDPQDILVSSPDGFQLVLTSATLGYRILPRLTSAHNYQGGLPLYRFLCELSQSGHPGYLHWDWRGLSDMPFLPRVSYKHWILSKASWNLDQPMIEEFLQNPKDLLAAWQKVQARLAIPRYVQIGMGDNQLLIDGQSLPALKLLRKYLKKTGQITLTEYLDLGSKSWLKAADDHFANEVVIPVAGNQQQSVLKRHDQNLNTGSGWLYVKIYCAPGLSDLVLENCIRPLCEQLLSSGKIQKWFFIRYLDPAPHLRVRFYQGNSLNCWVDIFQQLDQITAPYLENQTIASISTATYQRENERYAMLDYEAVESLFFADSVFVAGTIPVLKQDDDPDLYWMWALRSADALMQDLDLDLWSKIKVIEQLHGEFKQEFKQVISAVQIDKVYRSKKISISSVMNPAWQNSEHSAVLAELVSNRTKAFRLVFAKKALLPLQDSIQLATALVHMHLNRWFCDEQRKQEYVIYHYLSKFYDSTWKYYQHLKKTS